MHFRTLLAGCVAMTLSYTSPASAEEAKYPERPVTIVVNYPAGGPLDLVTRMVAEHASKRLDQPVVVENRPGAAGSIGAQYVARQTPDGYTLLLTVDTLYTVNPFVYTESDFDARESLLPISMAGSFNQILLSKPELGTPSLQAFITRAEDGDLMYASAGIGAPGHLTMEMLTQATDQTLTHVPYQGNAPATHALLSGEVDTGFLATAGALQHIRAGKLVPLAVSGKNRDTALPDIPTIAESNIPGLDNFDVEFGYVMMTPKNTPEEVIEVWSDAIESAFTDDNIRKRMATLNIVPLHGTPGQARERLDQTAQHWENVIQNAGISVD